MIVLANPPVGATVTASSRGGSLLSLLTAAPPNLHAQALVRGWVGRCLVSPQEWACDVAVPYLTLRLETAQRHTGVGLTDPALRPLRPVAWHERNDPGTAQLAWLVISGAALA